MSPESLAQPAPSEAELAVGGLAEESFAFALELRQTLVLILFPETPVEEGGAGEEAGVCPPHSQKAGSPVEVHQAGCWRTWFYALTAPLLTFTLVSKLFCISGLHCP